jgi:predicted metalloprotease with PDZ domain
VVTRAFASILKALPRRSGFAAAAAVCLIGLGSLGWLAPGARAVSPISYRFSFPEPQHRWMQVEANFPEIAAAALELRMSRASPGRYSLHDFAKNVYDVHAFGADGRELTTLQPDPYGWRVDGHGGDITVRYKVFGDRVDGTYLAIDTSHAHINMPAAIMWARGLDERPAMLTFDPPPGRPWHVATQLMAGSGPFEFTAPNLQYLMDSPTELGPVAMRQFKEDGHVFRFAAHHTGTDQELDALVRDVQKIVREEGTIYGEFPTYEPGHYTFLADYLSYANGDGMEHRNSTVITSSSSIAQNRDGLLDTVAHEFFHNWNVERIRPRSLEPFNFEAANMSGELWLAEGFTQYYGPLALSRAGLADLPSTATTFAGLVSSVVLSPAHELRSAEEMSRMAPFTDGGRTNDRTNWSTTYISYYPFGGAIALALDLSLREQFDGRVTLDDFMRAMWRVHGKPGGSRPGYVDRPYTEADAEARLSEVTGNPRFAREFFDRYIHGHEVADYERLLRPAGLVVRKERAGRAWIGTERLVNGHSGARLEASPAPGTPAYAAGLDRDDEITELAGQKIGSAERVADILRARKPGETIAMSITDRTGEARRASITTSEDPTIGVVPIESVGGVLNSAQRAFRQHWLGSQAGK